MSKLKFKPEIYRVALNQEQAVLTCNCFSEGFRPLAGPTYLGPGAVPGFPRMCYSVGEEEKVEGPSEAPCDKILYGMLAGTVESPSTAVS